VVEHRLLEREEALAADISVADRNQADESCEEI
jgi:hypothetical protein